MRAPERKCVDIAKYSENITFDKKQHRLDSTF